MSTLAEALSLTHAELYAKAQELNVTPRKPLEPDTEENHLALANRVLEAEAAAAAREAARADRPPTALELRAGELEALTHSGLLATAATVEATVPETLVEDTPENTAALAKLVAQHEADQPAGDADPGYEPGDSGRPALREVAEQRAARVQPIVIGGDAGADTSEN